MEWAIYLGGKYSKSPLKRLMRVLYLPYKKYGYGKNTFCIYFMYVSIVFVYKFCIFNKQFIFEHFLKKLMYTEKINHTECIRNF
ncbi:hypothetical protein GLOIN_2v1583187 [Rhizophagus irregularis DAOM 181602=DAOM 197198]|nr:hypothetical protein GLOIN_2v1583187 [Rhizophagus irregularis DAOM 181602=DAOM 197198]